MEGICADTFELSAFMEELNKLLEPAGLIGYPFNPEWYNSFRRDVARESPQLIESTGVGVVVISHAKFFDRVVFTFKDCPNSNYLDFALNQQIDLLRNTLHPSLQPRITNTDKPPFIHVQSIGHVASVDEYVPGDSVTLTPDEIDSIVTSRDPLIWGSTRDKIIGCSIHPRFGGFYAYRMLILLDGVSWPAGVGQPDPLHFLSADERRTVIAEFNQNPGAGNWRQYHATEKYSDNQIVYFSERSNHKRREILEALWSS